MSKPSAAERELALIVDARRIRAAIAADQIRTCHAFNTRRRVLHTIARSFWTHESWLARTGRASASNAKAARGLRAVQRVRF